MPILPGVRIRLRLARAMPIGAMPLGVTPLGVRPLGVMLLVLAPVAALPGLLVVAPVAAAAIAATVPLGGLPAFVAARFGESPVDVTALPQTVG